MPQACTVAFVISDRAGVDDVGGGGVGDSKVQLSVSAEDFIFFV